jgi:hypothetical protein
MNRRAFLQALLAGSAGFALDPERLLWVPGAKTIFLPSVPNPTDWTAWNYVTVAWDHGVVLPETVAVNGSTHLTAEDRGIALNWMTASTPSSSFRLKSYY